MSGKNAVAIGRIVHFHTPSPGQATVAECQAALVVKVWDPELEIVNLLVFDPDGGLPATRTSTRRDATATENRASWHWPPECPLAKVDVTTHGGPKAEMRVGQPA